jgi:AhpD family alkylhydroperoxidase
METRLNFQEKGKEAMAAMFALGRHLSKSGLGQHLLDLVYMRVSQINCCCFCLDMHSKDLLAHGESAQRLLVLNAWREAPFFTEKERAALAFAEAVTVVSGGMIPDEVYREAAVRFSEADLIDLTLAVIAINGWNRINNTFGAAVGAYQVGQYN